MREWTPRRGQSLIGRAFQVQCILCVEFGFVPALGRRYATLYTKKCDNAITVTISTKHCPRQTVKQSMQFTNTQTPARLRPVVLQKCTLARTTFF